MTQQSTVIAPSAGTDPVLNVAHHNCATPKRDNKSGKDSGNTQLQLSLALRLVVAMGLSLQ